LALDVGVYECGQPEAQPHSSQDPSTLGGLAHTFQSTVDYAAMSPATAIADVESAMGVVKDVLSVSARVTAESMVTAPDEGKNVGYLSDIRAFERKRDLLAWVNQRTARFEQTACDFRESWQEPGMLGMHCHYHLYSYCHYDYGCVYSCCYYYCHPTARCAHEKLQNQCGGPF
jgi:hypothetical protein